MASAGYWIPGSYLSWAMRIASATMMRKNGEVSVHVMSALAARSHTNIQKPQKYTCKTKIFFLDALPCIRPTSLAFQAGEVGRLVPGAPERLHLHPGLAPAAAAAPPLLDPEPAPPTAPPLLPLHLFPLRPALATVFSA
jgi:hypothetical protein